MLQSPAPTCTVAHADRADRPPACLRPIDISARTEFRTNVGHHHATLQAFQLATTDTTTHEAVFYRYDG